MSVHVPRVTIHMATSLDGFIARPDGRIDWMETQGEYAAGETLDAERVAAFLASVGCYVMGSRTYETALGFESRGQGWAYGDTPVFVLTTRQLPRTRASVQFLSGDLAELMQTRLRPVFQSIWVVGGGTVAGECLRRGLADEVSCAMLPVLIGEGVRFFDHIDADVPLRLAEVHAYRQGMVELRYLVQRPDRS